MSEEERRASAILGKQALVLIATGRILRQNMINAAREACIALRWRFGKAAQRVLAGQFGKAP